MKCTSCSGRLDGTMTFCPFCGVRQDVNLRQIHFRDLGSDASLPCPHCTTPLDVIEFDGDLNVRIERCTTCFGMFFNPGELETLLDTQTNPLVWLDPAHLEQLKLDAPQEETLAYRKCPKCAEWMSRVNFGGRSGVVIDRCGAHGVWLEGSELRRLTEWWRAGGKLIYQKNEATRTKRIYDTKPELKRSPTFVSMDNTQTAFGGTSTGPEDVADALKLTFSAIVWILSWL